MIWIFKNDLEKCYEWYPVYEYILYMLGNWMCRNIEIISLGKVRL